MAVANSSTAECSSGCLSHINSSKQHLCNLRCRVHPEFTLGTGGRVGLCRQSRTQHSAAQAQTEWHLSTPVAEVPVHRKEPWEQGQLRASDISCELPCPPALPRCHSSVAVTLSNSCGPDTQRGAAHGTLAPLTPPCIHGNNSTHCCPQEPRGLGRGMVSFSVSLLKSEQGEQDPSLRVAH